MTPRQIEQLIAFSNGNLCGRITRDRDNSIVTAAESPSHGIVGFAFAASLSLTSIAIAQTGPVNETKQPQEVAASTNQRPGATEAVGGVITDSQGALVVGAAVTVTRNREKLGATRTNEAGQFEFALVPGEYEIQVIAPGFSSASRPLSVTTTEATIANVSLTPGTEISVQVTAFPAGQYATMGTMSASFGHWYTRWGYRLRHPIAYGKYIFHRS